MNENYITVVGNVVADPMERTTRSGSPFTTFRIASTPRHRLPDGRYVDGSTSFFGVCVFNVLAANVAKSLEKGQPVIVHGRLRVNEWRDGKDGLRVGVEIDASQVGHDLSRGQATFRRMSRAEALGEEPLADPEVQAALHAVPDLAAGDATASGRPANVDANGEVHDEIDGDVHRAAGGVPASVSSYGDPETDPYVASDVAAG